MQDFATKYRNARKAAGLSQGAVQLLLKIPTRTQQHWESGERLPPEYIQLLVLNELSRHSVNELIPGLLALADQLQEELTQTQPESK